MTDEAATTDQSALTADAQFDSALQRVNFQPGILLGADALNTEQNFHLRRLTRAQRWLTGPGTVFGLYVGVSVPTKDTTDLLLTVQPGYAIDGLGREIIAGQAYGVSLRDWIATPPFDLTQFYKNGVLALSVTARSESQSLGLQPVVSDLFDAGLNPVVSARVNAGFALELIGDLAFATGAADAPAKPLPVWAPGGKAPAASDLPGTISAREQTMLNGLPADQASFLKMQAWLMQQPPPSFDDSPGTEQSFVNSARLLLASVHVTLANLTDKPTPAGTAINNLVRPFIRPNALLSALSLP
jgi:hypothetical protein